MGFLSLFGRRWVCIVVSCHFFSGRGICLLTHSFSGAVTNTSAAMPLPLCESRNFYSVRARPEKCGISRDLPPRTNGGKWKVKVEASFSFLYPWLQNLTPVHCHLRPATSFSQDRRCPSHVLQPTESSKVFNNFPYRTFRTDINLYGGSVIKPSPPPSVRIMSNERIVAWVNHYR